MPKIFDYLLNYFFANFFAGILGLKEDSFHELLDRSKNHRHLKRIHFYLIFQLVQGIFLPKPLLCHLNRVCHRFLLNSILQEKYEIRPEILFPNSVKDEKMTLPNGNRPSNNLKFPIHSNPLLH